MTKLLLASAAAHAMVALGAVMTPAERRAGRFMRTFDGHDVGPIRTKDEGGGSGGGGDAKSVDQIADELLAKVTDATKGAKESAEKALEEASKAGTLSETTKAAVDEALSKMNGFSEQLREFGQAVDAIKRAGGGDAEVKSLGNQFIESESFKKLAEDETKGQHGRATLEVKATITSATADAAGSAGAAIAPTRLPGILQLPQRRLVIRDLLSQGQMGGNALQYIRQTGFTNNAGMVAEGGLKPQSDIKLELVDTTAKVIAHFMKASRQVLDDAPQLSSLINGHLLFGLAFREEAQILYGDGVGQNLLGIVPQATGYVRPAAIPAGSEVNAIDTIRFAMLQAVLALYPATGHVLNPIDWARVETLRDDMGRYIIGNPQADGQIMRLWRLPVVETPAITAGKFLTGAFQLGAQLFDRWLARIQLATENEDDFIHNLVTVLAEERLALAVYRPEAFIYGDLVWPA
jgi:HK97 family phage major capsid protein